MLGLQRVPGGHQQIVMITVQFVRAGKHQLVRTHQVRPRDQEAERLVNVAGGEHMRQRALLGLEVLKVGQRAQVRS